MKHFIAVTVNLVVESDMTTEDVVKEFAGETQYEFPSTENVKVEKTELLECWERDFGGN